MKKKTGKTIGQMTSSRYVWKFKPIERIKQSGKVYKRNKRVKESENKMQNI